MVKRSTDTDLQTKLCVVATSVSLPWHGRGCLVGMSYSWVFKQSRVTVKGAEHLGEIGAGQQFESQEEAEAWLSETWPELQDAGVDEVTLMQDEDVVYGPMGLSEE